MRKLFLLLAAIAALVGLTSTNSIRVNAQDTTPDGITGYEFVKDPVIRTTPFFAKVTANANVRAVPATKDNTELFRAQTGDVVMVVTETYTDDGNWVLSRVYNKDGEYLGYGWVNTDVARLSAAIATPILVTPECTMTDEDAVQMPRGVRWAKDGKQDWIFDTDSSSCNIIGEGRQTEIEQHHVYVLKTNKTLNTVDTTQGFHILLEGSYWESGETRNMSKWAQDFALAKNQNMLDNNFQWLIFLHDLTGKVSAWKEPLNAQEATTCTFTEPTIAEVSGVASEGGFRASVGSHACKTLAAGQFDSDDALEVIIWVDAQDNFVFHGDMVFWVFPESMTDDEILGLMDAALFDYVFDHEGRSAVGEVFQVEPDGVPGETGTFDWTMPRERPGA